VSIVDRGFQSDTVQTVPGPPQRRLTESEIRRLQRVEARIAENQREWAVLVRKLGMSAVARELGLTPGAVLHRVKKWEQGS